VANYRRDLDLDTAVARAATATATRYVREAFASHPTSDRLAHQCDQPGA